MTTTTRAIRSTSLLAVIALVTTLAAAPPAQAAPVSPTSNAVVTAPRELPGGWARSSDGRTLTWTSPTLIPIGGSRLDVVAGERLLGTGVLSRNQRSVSVPLSPDAATDPSVAWADLAVVASGRRLSDPSVAAVPSGRLPGDMPLEGTLPRLARQLVSPDPGLPGPYATVTGKYALPRVAIAGLPAKVEVKGVVVAPRGTTGERPLVLLLHGRHSTCYRGVEESTGDWPCPPGFTAIPSYRGYLETQQLLASQGYVTVSISANGINGQDWVLQDGGAAARSELVRHHLALWERWSRSAASHALAPTAVRAAPRADLDRVLLVGHSRGGEGVNRAALDSTTGPRVPWTIRGLVHIGPTAFGQNPAPGVPVEVLLPYCDGDVSDLQGQAYVDAGRHAGKDPVLRSAVMVLGANHNFFNKEWTPGEAVAPAWDDWGDDTDRVCGTRPGSTRLTPAAQRQVGTTYTAAAAAVFLAEDESALPLLDGTPARAASTGKARVISHALGGRRSAVVVPTPATTLATTGRTTARLCRTAEANQVRKQCSTEAYWGADPHFLPLFYLAGEPSRRAIDVGWTKPGGSARVGTSGTRSLAGARALELRVVVPAGAPATTFGVRLTDTTGRQLVLPDTTLQGLPRTRNGTPGKDWAREVRLPLTAATVRTSTIDLDAVSRVDVLPRSASGRLWLLDVWGWQPGLNPAAPLRLSRLDVGAKTVNEGSKTHTVRVPLTVTGPTRTSGRVWVVVVDPTSFEAPVGRLVDVPAGTRRLDVDITVAGDRRDDPDVLQYQVLVKAVKGLAIGDYFGGLTVADDDPSPTLTVEPVATSVAEGEGLRWRFQLSEVTDAGVYIQLVAIAPEAGSPPELSTKDLPAEWLEWQGIDPNLPATPLSEAFLYAWVYIEQGTDSAELVIPTRSDTKVEGPESLTLRIDEAGQVVLPDPVPTLVATVNDPT